MTDSSSVVLLPSTAEVCRTLASSMMVWSKGEIILKYSQAKLDIMGVRELASYYDVKGKKLFPTRKKQLFPTHDVSLRVPCRFLSGHLRVLQVLEEFIETVSLPTFPPLPELIGYQRCQTPCEHLKEGK